MTLRCKEVGRLGILVLAGVVVVVIALWVNGAFREVRDANGAE